jgi:hypothetical protein
LPKTALPLLGNGQGETGRLIPFAEANASDIAHPFDSLQVRHLYRNNRVDVFKTVLTGLRNSKDDLDT